MSQSTVVFKIENQPSQKTQDANGSCFPNQDVLTLRNVPLKPTDDRGIYKFPPLNIKSLLILYKWNSNVPEMDDQRHKTEAKVLGIQWDKTEDHFRVNCDTSQPEILTKRKML